MLPESSGITEGGMPKNVKSVIPGGRGVYFQEFPPPRGGENLGSYETQGEDLGKNDAFSRIDRSHQN